MVSTGQLVSIAAYKWQHEPTGLVFYVEPRDNGMVALFEIVEREHHFICQCSPYAWRDIATFIANFNGGNA